MNTLVDQVKTAASAKLRLLRADLEDALGAHQRFLLAGFVLGLMVGAWLTHVL